MPSSTIHSFILIKSAVNEIGDRGATSLNDALKSNTTLTELNLESGHKKKHHMNGIYKQSTLFHSHQINRERSWRNRSNIVK